MDNEFANANSELPMVSIGMPIYNGEKFIERAIESILSQSYPHFELIISDNASTDRTGEICCRYAKRDSRIRYIRQAINIGPTENFRCVLMAARHDRFIWAAADDWWDRDRLERLVAALESADAVVCGTVRRYVEDTPYAEFVPISFAKGQWWRFLMREEARCEKVYYIYGLMWKECATKAFAQIRDEYWGDALFCYRLVWFGNLKSIPGATLHAKSHLQSVGDQQAMSFRYSLLRALCAAHPSSYYYRYLQFTPRKLWNVVLPAIVIKAIVSQLHLWWRAYRRLMLGRPFVHGALPDGEYLVKSKGL